jgi:glutamine amidotransferase
MKIAIIDYGMGNLRSVEKAFHKVGASGAFVTDDPAEITKADKAVLPGDGAFDTTMLSLRRSGVDRVSLEFVQSGKPFLGICVGMQVLLTDSDEGEAGVQGLNIVPGHVKKFPNDLGLKIPQIGWNNIAFKSGSAIGGDSKPGAMAYFLNSYYCAPDDSADVAATTDYGLPFCSAIQRENVWATQFHPEKSGSVGLTILANFAQL